MAKILSLSGGLKRPPKGFKVPAWLSMSAPEMQAALAPSFKSIFLETDKNFKEYLRRNDNSVASGIVENPGAEGTYDTGRLSNSLSYTFEVRRTRGATRFYYRVASGAPYFQFLDEGFETTDSGINLDAIKKWVKRRGSNIIIEPRKRKTRSKFGPRKNASTKSAKEKAYDATIAKIWSSTRDRQYRGLLLRRRLLRFYEDASRRYGLPQDVHAVLWRPTDYSTLEPDDE